VFLSLFCSFGKIIHIIGSSTPTQKAPPAADQ